MADLVGPWLVAGTKWPLLMMVVRVARGSQGHWGHKVVVDRGGKGVELISHGDRQVDGNWGQR